MGEMCFILQSKEKIKAENQIRVIMLLNGFLKRTNKDYKRALKIADRLLIKYEL